MDVHSRFILVSLLNLLEAALMLCLPDRADRNLRAARSSIQAILNEHAIPVPPPPPRTRQAKRPVKL